MNPIVKVIEPSGVLDGAKGNELRREVGDILGTGVDVVLIDFQNITFMNSTGLGAVISALKAVKTAGGRLFICSVSEEVKMLFELTKMDRIFDTFTNRDEFNRQVLSVN